MARKGRGLTTKYSHSNRNVGGPYYKRTIKNAGRPFGRAKISRKFGSGGRPSPNKVRKM